MPFESNLFVFVRQRLAAGIRSVPKGYVGSTEHRLCESVRRAYPRVGGAGDSGLVLSGAEPVAFPGVEGVVGFPGGIGWGRIGVGVLWGAAGVTPGCVARRGDRWLLGRLRGHPG